MANAPVCHIPPVTPDNGQLPKNLPAVPPATDLKSALNAINALRQIIQIITNQQPIIINQGGANNAVSKQNATQWAEISRTTEVVRVFNPNDSSQYVDVERINQLVMGDRKSKQRWVWNRGR